MFKSELNNPQKLKRYRENYFFHLNYVNNQYNLKNIKGGNNLYFQARLMKKKTNNFFGPPLFEMKITVGPMIVKIDDIRSKSVAALSNPRKEMFFHMLVQDVKDEMIRSGKHGIIMSSQDYFIQEPFLDNNFRLKTIYNENKEPVYVGMWRKDNDIKQRNLLLAYM